MVPIKRELYRYVINNLLGESGKQVLLFYDSVHKLITNVSFALKIPQVCISTSMIFFHKFYKIKGNVFNEEKDIISLACLFLATKVCNFLVSLTRLIPAYAIVKNLKDDKNSLLYITEKVKEAEFSLLSNIGFDINVDLPYIYIDRMKGYLNDYVKNNKFIKIIHNFINDSFKLPLCLYYSPIKIALSCVYLLQYHFKVSLPKTNEGLEWYNLLLKEISFDEIKEISLLINLLYFTLNESKKINHETSVDEYNKEYLSNKRSLDIC